LETSQKRSIDYDQDYPPLGVDTTLSKSNNTKQNPLLEKGEEQTTPLHKPDTISCVIKSLNSSIVPPLTFNSDLSRPFFGKTSPRLESCSFGVPRASEPTNINPKNISTSPQRASFNAAIGSPPHSTSIHPSESSTLSLFDAPSPLASICESKIEKTKCHFSPVVGSPPTTTPISTCSTQNLDICSPFSMMSFSSSSLPCPSLPKFMSPYVQPPTTRNTQTARANDQYQRISQIWGESQSFDDVQNAWSSFNEIAPRRFPSSF